MRIRLNSLNSKHLTIVIWDRGAELFHLRIPVEKGESLGPRNLQATEVGLGGGWGGRGGGEEGEEEEESEEKGAWQVIFSYKWWVMMNFLKTENNWIRFQAGQQEQSGRACHATNDRFYVHNGRCQ